jgi:hypothetical protein
MPLREASLAGHFTMPSMLKPLEKWDVQKSTHSMKTIVTLNLVDFRKMTNLQLEHPLQPFPPTP